MAVNVTLVPAQIAPEGDAATVTDGVTAACRDREPKLVAVVMPARPANEVAVILPVADVVVVAWTCRPLINTTSNIEVAVATMFTETVVLVMPIRPANTILRPGMLVTVGVVTVLNCHPDGAVSTSMCGPGEISPVAPSARVMPPSVVNAGALPVCAVFEQMLVPFVPAVTLIAARLWEDSKQIIPVSRSKIFFIYLSIVFLPEKLPLKILTEINLIKQLLQI